MELMNILNRIKIFYLRIILSCAENNKDLEEFIKVKDELSRIIDKFLNNLF
jgi:hypothetical protein